MEGKDECPEKPPAGQSRLTVQELLLGLWLLFRKGQVVGVLLRVI